MNFNMPQETLTHQQKNSDRVSFPHLNKAFCNC